MCLNQSTISSVKGLRLIVNLLNGYLRTPKVHQLYLLIEWLNKHHGSYFKNLPLDESPIDSNSWLAGFIDADGSFGIRHTKPTVLDDGHLRKRRMALPLVDLD